MSVVCATATPVDLLEPAKPWDTPPRSELSSEGSDISSAGTPLQKLTGRQQIDTSTYQRTDVSVLGECGSECHDPDFDLRLVTRLVEVLGVKVPGSLAQALGDRFGAKPREVDRAIRLLFRCLRLLHLCGYPRQDIEVLVAQASVYLREVALGMRRDGDYEMGLTETIHVLCVLIYIAHAYCEDHNCPLHIWHKHLFQRYCTLRTLNSAVVGLLERLQFRLRVESGDLEARLTFLRSAFEAPLSAVNAGA